MRCKICNGECQPIGGGKFKCMYCGSEFSEQEGAATTRSAATPKSNSGANVFEQNINGILEIRWQAGGYVYSGSGFLISKNGYAVTNTHVVTYDDGRSCRTVTVKLCGQELTASVEVLGDDRHGSGKGVDLALIKLSNVPAGAKVLEFEDFENVRIGEQVYVIGNSLGYGTCITSGIVSDKARLVDGKMLLMTDCAVNGGNSGGPIFNEKGKVIGAIVSGIDRAEGMNFAIPSGTILEFIENNRRTVPFASGEFRLPPKKYTVCPKCGNSVPVGKTGFCWCTNCGHQFQH